MPQKRFHTTNEVETVYFAGKPQLESFLGVLEAAVMEVFWETPRLEISTRQMTSRLRVEYRESIATPTVNTTLHRLVEKGLITLREERKPGTSRAGRCWYVTALTKEEFLRYQVETILNALHQEPETEEYVLEWIGSLMSNKR